MDLDLLNQDLKNMQDDLPFQAIYNGSEYRCNIVSMNSNDRQFLQNNIQQRIEIALSFVLSELDNQILVNEIVTFNQKEYRVLNTDLSPDLLELRVYMGDKYAS